MSRWSAALCAILLAPALAGCVWNADDAAPATDHDATSEAEQPEAGSSAAPPEVRFETRAVGESSAINATGGGETVAPPAAAVAFGEPVRMFPYNLTYEPSVEVGPDGTVYVTAAMCSALDQVAEQHLASPIHYSTDAGATWSIVDSPAGAHRYQWGCEGEIAVDGEGRLYYVDTYLADNTFSRWASSEVGPQWETTRPFQGTLSADDRPWLAAHGDGIVYYLGNTVLSAPATNNAVAAEKGSRIWFYASEDRGETWSTGYGFPLSMYCMLAASPADDRTAGVACMRMEEGDPVGEMGGASPVQSVVFYETHDRGATWTESVVAHYEHTRTDAFPVTTDYDASGVPYVAWTDGRPADGVPTRVYLASAADGWRTHDVTPFEGHFEKIWLTMDRGTAAFALYGSNLLDEPVWYPYAVVADDITEPSVTWTAVRLADTPSATGEHAPDDFLQIDAGPDGRVHVVFGREDQPCGVPCTEKPYRDTFHVVQTTGANIRG